MPVNLIRDVHLSRGPLIGTVVPASVILAGKHDSRHHSTTGLANIAVTETSYQMLEVFSFCDRERALPTPIIMLTFLVNKKYNDAFRDFFF